MQRVITQVSVLTSTVVLMACGSTAVHPSDGGTQTDGGAQTAKDASPDASGDASKPTTFSQVAYLSTSPERSFPGGATQVLEADKDYIATIETDIGSMDFDLYEKDTPVTVNSFVFLALHHFYEGIAFHRVIDGFMAQSGDPNSVSGSPSTWGTGGPGYKFVLEVVPTLNFDAAGVLGMARTSSPNTNGSQFFITFAAATNLDQQYTVWGKLTSGSDVLNNIVKGEPPATPTRIKEVRISAK